MPISVSKNDEFLNFLKCSESSWGRGDIYIYIDIDIDIDI